MSEDTERENILVNMLNDITEKLPKGVVVSEDLFNMLEEEKLIYVLGHFYISVKNVLPPFCPFYLHKQLPNETYIICDKEEECDKLLLELNYKVKRTK